MPVGEAVMPTPGAQMARIEEGQKFFKEALSEMKQGQRELAERVEHVADEMRRNSERTTSELHTAAVALTRCADRLDQGARHMEDSDDRIDDLEARTKSLETTRVRQAAFISAAGIAGGIAGWFIDHASKWLTR